MLFNHFSSFATDFHILHMHIYIYIYDVQADRKRGSSICASHRTRVKCGFGLLSVSRTGEASENHL